MLMALALFFAAILLFGHSSRAVDIPIVNHSFEANVIPDGFWIDGFLTGWAIFGFTAGPQNWTDAQYPGANDFDAIPSTVPDGRNSAFIRSPLVAIQQTLRASLQPNTEYRLDFFVGDRFDCIMPNYSAELIAGLTELAFNDTEVRPANGQWLPASVTYRTGQSHPQLGEPLVLRFFTYGFSDPPGRPGLYQVGIDNVRLTATPLGPPTPTWNVDASGNWSLASNWSGGVPNAVGAKAVFGGAITLNRTITVDTPITVGQIDFSDANFYTLAGPNSLTLDATSGEAQLNVLSGSHAISAPLTLADNTVITVTPAASKFSITGPLNANGRTLTKAGSGGLTLNNLRGAGLSINGGAVAIAPAGTAAGTSVLDALSIAGVSGAWIAKLDMHDNDAVLQSSAASKAAYFTRLYNQVKQGFNRGNWQGLGITSATAAMNLNADTGLALVDNEVLGATTFSGQPVNADSILLKYTYYGDIDQNGQVDADDLTVFANSFGRTAGATQIDGDIDFNGAVDADDLTVFANNFNKGVGNPLANGDVQAVPEPSGIALVGIAVATLIWIGMRRRWNQDSTSVAGMR
jgi:hypothetical protein